MTMTLNNSLTDVPGMNMILDIGHYNIAGEPVVDFFSCYHSRIKAISLSDNDGLRDMHAPLGSGNIDWPMIKTMIEDFNWQGVYIFETKSVDLGEDVEFFNQLGFQSNIA